MKGKFYVIEGMDGSGKTTLCSRLAKMLQESGKEVVKTNEPRGTMLGIRLESLMASDRYLPATQMFLHAAARCEHVQNVIKPALAAGKDVVCDRYFLSTIAYQGAAQRVPEEVITSANSAACGTTYPDKCFILDLPIEEAMRRAKARGTKDRFDAQTESFFLRVQRRYRQMAMPPNYVLIDASGTESETYDKVFSLLCN